MGLGGRRIRLVWNANSGGGRVSAQELCSEFERNGCQCVVTELTPEIDLRALHQQDDKAVAWVAAGGDGTVNAVAGVVAGTGRVMGVLPVGTLNHFARDLKMPAETIAAIEVVARCGWRPVDAAEANGHLFVNCSSLGIYPEVVMARDRMLKGKRWSKWLAMVVAAARALVRFRQMEIEVELEGQVHRWRTPLLFIGNNVYGMEGPEAGQRSCIDQGTLAIVVASKMNRAGAFWMLCAALIGRLRSLPQLEEFLVTGFTVRARTRRVRVAFDGEVRRMAPRLAYRTLPGTLCVIAPDGVHAVDA